MARIPTTSDDQGIRPDDEQGEAQGTSFSEMLEQGALYQARPLPSERDPRDVWINESAPLAFDADLPPNIQAAYDQIGAGIDQILDAVTPAGYQMADEREDVLWGLTNVFHAQEMRVARQITSLAHVVETLEKTTAERIRTDGEEMASQELEDKVHELQSAASKRDLFESFRDYAASAYFKQVGKEWEPRTRTHVSQTGNVTPVIDAQEFLRARRSTQPVPDIPEGTVIAVTGSTTITDHHIVLRELDRIRSKYPDMILVHGAGKGPPRIASKWAETHDVPQVPIPPDFKRDGKRAVPIRDDLILQTKPIGIVSFTNDDEPLPRLHTQAIKRAIHVHHVGFDATGRAHRTSPRTAPRPAPSSETGPDVSDETVAPEIPAQDSVTVPDSDESYARLVSRMPQDQQHDAHLTERQKQGYAEALPSYLRPRPGRSLSDGESASIPAHLANRPSVAVTATLAGAGDETVYATLDKALEETPDMVLLHHAPTNDADDPLRAVAAWAHKNEIPSLIAHLDRETHGARARDIADAQILQREPRKLIAFLAPSAPTPSLYKAALSRENPIPTEHRHKLPAGTVIAIDSTQAECDPKTVHDALDSRFAAHTDMILVHPNMKTAAMSHVASWAEEKGVPTYPFTPDYETFGKLAVPLRNQQIVHTEPAELLAFTDPDSSRPSLVRAARDLLPIAEISIPDPAASQSVAPNGQLDPNPSYPQPGERSAHAAAEPAAAAPTPAAPQPDANRIGNEQRREERRAQAILVPSHDLTTIPAHLTHAEASQIEQIETATESILAFVKATYPDDFMLNRHDEIPQREALFSQVITTIHRDLDGPRGLMAKAEHLSRATADLDYANDGTEILQNQIEDNASELEQVNENIILLENIRASLAAEYKNETGRQWVPPASYTPARDRTVTAAAAAAINTVDEIKHQYHQARLPQGRPIAITALADSADRETVHAYLDKLHEKYPDTFLIHGNAHGTLQHVNEWARQNGVEQVHFPPNFSVHKDQALSHRDRSILSAKPFAVVEFGESNSTVLAKLARNQSVPVHTVNPKVRRIVPDQRDVAPRQDNLLKPQVFAENSQTRSSDQGRTLAM